MSTKKDQAEEIVHGLWRLMTLPFMLVKSVPVSALERGVLKAHCEVLDGVKQALEARLDELSKRPGPDVPRRRRPRSKAA